MHRLTKLLIILVISSVGLWADTIDFEGLPDQSAVGAIATLSNVVTFATTSGSGTAYIAHVGSPQSAFKLDDTPDGTNPLAGDILEGMLTDEVGNASAPFVTVASNYLMSFATPVTSLSLLLLDYRVDGGPDVGAVATLQLFADALLTVPLGLPATYTVNGAEDNGEIVLLSIAGAPAAGFARLSFSQPDVGTAIDNVTFTTVPEPGSIALLGGGLLALTALTRRKARRES